MKKITIRTNDKCGRCGGFLVFEVQDEFRDHFNEMRTGVWKCTICEWGSLGVVMRNLKTRASLEI